MRTTLVGILLSLVLLGGCVDTQAPQTNNFDGVKTYHTPDGAIHVVAFGEGGGICWIARTISSVSISCR